MHSLAKTFIVYPLLLSLSGIMNKRKEKIKLYKVSRGNG